MLRARGTGFVTLAPLALAGLFTLAGVSSGTAADAQARDDSDDTTWVTEVVPGTEISVRHPAAWTLAPTELLQEQVGDKETTVLLSVIDAAGNQDNFAVNRFTGTKAYWYRGLGEYKKTVKESAHFSDGKVVSVAKTKVGRMPAYRHVETYVDPTVGGKVFYGDIEIREGKGSVLTLAATISADRPHARRLVESLLDDVAA
jgi:hypothetical protein